MPREAVRSSPIQRLLTGFAATLVVAVAARIAFPLPFTPVPFTLQPLAVLLVGLFLGPVDGPLVMIAYLAEGAAGFPVFSPTGVGGVMQLIGPTGGFLLAYPAVAFLAGWLVRVLAARTGPFVSALVAGLAAVSLLFVAGAAWFSHWSGLQAHALWVAAVLPFIPGEVAKVIIAAGIYRSSTLAARGVPFQVS